jgi:hypothetical protein
MRSLPGVLFKHILTGVISFISIPNSLRMLYGSSSLSHMLLTTNETYRFETGFSCMTLSMQSLFPPRHDIKMQSPSLAFLRIREVSGLNFGLEADCL